MANYRVPSDVSMWFARMFRKTQDKRDAIEKIAPSLKMKPAVWSIGEDDLKKLLEHVKAAKDLTDTDKRYMTKLLSATSEAAQGMSRFGARSTATTSS